MNMYIIDNFCRLLRSGIQIVRSPLAHSYFKLENNVISIFTDPINKAPYKTYNICDIHIIRLNTIHYTISMLFKDADKIVVGLSSHRSLQLFYKYFLMLLEHKLVSVDVEDVL